MTNLARFAPAYVGGNARFAAAYYPAVTAYAPGTDVSVAGWIPSTGGSVADTLDDTSRTEYSTSPDLTTPARMSWQGDNGVSTSIPAGTWDFQIDCKYIGTGGQIRIVLYDASNAVVGTGAWVTPTGADATYTSTITTTGVSTEFELELQ